MGDRGIQWIAGLGRCVAFLEQKWSINIGDVLTGGSESLVVEALCADGSAAVLKIGLPGPTDLATEAKVFRLAEGRGYATLIAHDELNNAILLERLDKPLADLGLSIRSQMEVICSTLLDAWIPLEDENSLMTGAEKAAWLAAFIAETWQALGKPCEKNTRDVALSFAVERQQAFVPSDSVLVHGDAHAYNALTMTRHRADESVRCKFVDPDGLYAERACDLAVPMRGWNSELLAGDAVTLGRQRCEILAELTGVDEHAIWQWGFIERVSTGLLLLKIGLREEGSETLAVADRWQQR